jgi:hypothetical protein
MVQTRTSTPARPRSIGFDSWDEAEREARSWLLRRLRWEDRLTELHALAGVQHTARCLEVHRAAERSSGVLDWPGCSAGVYA